MRSMPASMSWKKNLPKNHKTDFNPRKQGVGNPAHPLPSSPHDIRTFE
jgi:hypothetical protein